MQNLPPHFSLCLLFQLPKCHQQHSYRNHWFYFTRRRFACTSTWRSTQSRQCIPYPNPAECFVTQHVYTKVLNDTIFLFSFLRVIIVIIMTVTRVYSVSTFNSDSIHAFPCIRRRLQTKVRRTVYVNRPTAVVVRQLERVQLCCLTATVEVVGR